MTNRKSVTTREGNKNNRKKYPGKKGLGTSKECPDDERIVIRIPKKAKIYDFLTGPNEFIKVPRWELLDMIYGMAEFNREAEVIRIYDEFVKRICLYCPSKEKELNKLRPLIIKHILKGDSLSESYYKEIREL